MKYILLVLACFPFAGPLSAAEEPLTPEQQQYVDAVERLWESIDRQKGSIRLPNEVATLAVPDSFVYIDPADTETFLVDIWGNPPGAGAQTLGMILPARGGPLDEDFWGVTIDYEQDGYVSDENADEIDYDELLQLMQEDTAEASKQRVQQGYESIRLVGWAAEPFYDREAHKLHWAKEIQFGDYAINTLNYDIRVLGRKGVLVLSFIADMTQKPLIDSKIDTVLALAEFDQGYRYEDFDPQIDKVAAYGLGALVAGKALAKTGFLAAALVFLKKFGVVIVIAIGAFMGRLFRKKPA
jgi:uncharacterized membrane-anchored protein